jgi:hypothetical protein
VRRAFDSVTNARVRAATAQIATHGDIDVRICRRFVVREERCRRHNLSRLAVPALYDLELEPRTLGRGAAWCLTYPLDSGYARGPDRRYRQYAGPDRTPVQVYGACPALGDTASKLCPGEAKDVAQCPQQRHLGGQIRRARLSIDVETNLHGVDLSASAVFVGSLSSDVRAVSCWRFRAMTHEGRKLHALMCTREIQGEGVQPSPSLSLSARRCRQRISCGISVSRRGSQELEQDLDARTIFRIHRSIIATGRNSPIGDVELLLNIVPLHFDAYFEQADRNAAEKEIRP